MDETSGAAEAGLSYERSRTPSLRPPRPAPAGSRSSFPEAFRPALRLPVGWTLLFAINTGFVAAVAVAFAKTLGFSPLPRLLRLGLPDRALLSRRCPFLVYMPVPAPHRAGLLHGGRHPRLPLLAAAPVSHTVF